MNQLYRNWKNKYNELLSVDMETWKNLSLIFQVKRIFSYNKH